VSSAIAGPHPAHGYFGGLYPWLWGKTGFFGNLKDNVNQLIGEVIRAGCLPFFGHVS
jgi:hypothetical protein